jgi:hypothetical protein
VVEKEKELTGSLAGDSYKLSIDISKEGKSIEEFKEFNRQQVETIDINN